MNCLMCKRHPIHDRRKKRCQECSKMCNVIIARNPTKFCPNPKATKDKCWHHYKASLREGKREKHSIKDQIEDFIWKVKEDGITFREWWQRFYSHQNEINAKRQWNRIKLAIRLEGIQLKKVNIPLGEGRRITKYELKGDN